MVYNILLQPSFLGPCPPSTDILGTKTLSLGSGLCFRLVVVCNAFHCNQRTSPVLSSFYTLVECLCSTY